MVLRKAKSAWLFDAGEDAQRQLLRQALVRTGKLDRIFLTGSSASSVLGLPGMACLICV
jgi:ribonuclease BN (tRNA processing enzyme)